MRKQRFVEVEHSERQEAWVSFAPIERTDAEVIAALARLLLLASFVHLLKESVV